ncbi:MAG: fatty acid desaturase [Bacteroidota bacterium]
MQFFRKHTGILVASIVMSAWLLLLLLHFNWTIDWSHPWTWLGILVQTHLFTGLFITAHDAMHGSVSPGHARINHLIGRLCAIGFMFNSYKLLRPKHYEHHRFVGTEQDPDFHGDKSGFWFWYLKFVREYVRWPQILLAAVTFNVLLHLVGIQEINLILYWVIPSLLSTLQLFYFGTFLPHMGDHHNEHRSHSQGKNHLWAFLSCYFFGYHFEHHDQPRTPWWLLWKVKEAQ